jgi:hypothetical protein
MADRDFPERFSVSFSFAGSERQLVKKIAEAVEKRLGRSTVFLDEWYQGAIAGSDADLRLQSIYLNSALVVVCISGKYDDRPWTKMEHAAIRARQMASYAEADAAKAGPILPLRVGDGNVEGVLLNAIVPDVRDNPVDQTADIIVSRLKLVCAELVPAPAETTEEANPAEISRAVYLAEVTPDMEDARARMAVFLGEHGWKVYPAEEYPTEKYQDCVRGDLKKSLAYVQLLGPHPWKRGGYDQLQVQCAREAGIKQYLYRSLDLDVESLKDEAHKALLRDANIRVTGFEDFKVFIRGELESIARSAEIARATAALNAGDPRLVRVVIRSPDPDPLWEKVYEYFDRAGNILPFQLRSDESFESVGRAEPCQGFLVVCDKSGMEPGEFSPRDSLDEVRRIQMREKKGSARLPVGLVYWPPPEPRWPLLLRVKTQNMFCIVGEQQSDWQKFFAAVMEFRT